MIKRLYRIFIKYPQCKERINRCGYNKLGYCGYHTELKNSLNRKEYADCQEALDNWYLS